MARTGTRPGRKAQPAKQGQRVSLGLKVTPAIKNRLDAAAKDNGRTQSQEAEVRIEHSFDREELFSEVLNLRYGTPLAGLLMAIGKAMGDAGTAACLFSQLGNRNREPWADNPFGYDQAVTAAIRILKAFKPAGDPSRPENFLDSDRIGENIAREILAELHPDIPIFPEHNPHDAETAKMRRSLGAEMLKRVPTPVVPVEEKK